MKKNYILLLLLWIHFFHTSFSQVTLVKDINPSYSYSVDGPDNLLSFGEHLYFRASNDTNGFQLWRTDGTTLGTTQAVNISKYSGVTGDILYSFDALNSHLLLNAKSGTYITDGSQNGTKALKNGYGTLFNLGGGNVLFLRTDSLLLYNETTNTTSSLKVFSRSSIGNVNTSSSKFCYFELNDYAKNKLYLYVTDGTLAGTQLVDTLLFASSIVDVYQDHVYYAQCDEVWEYDPIAHTTKKVYNFAFSNCPLQKNAVVRGKRFQNKLYVVVNPIGSYNTYSLSILQLENQVSRDSLQPFGVTGPYDFSFVNNRFLFFTDSYDFFSVDYSADHLTGLVHFDGVTENGPDWYTQSDTKLFFYGSMSGKGWEPMESDGTVAGTKLIADIRDGDLSSYPKYFTLHKGDLYFQAYGDQGYELYKYGNASVTTDLEEEAIMEPKKHVKMAYTLLGEPILNIEEHEGFAILLFSDGTRQKIYKQ